MTTLSLFLAPLLLPLQIQNDLPGPDPVIQGEIRSLVNATSREDYRLGLERLRTLADGEEERFLPLCPTFVVELHSPSDPLAAVEEKMRENLENGSRLGWLIDPRSRRVHVYRCGADVEILDEPLAVSGAPELPDFVLELAPIWDPGW